MSICHISFGLDGVVHAISDLGFGMDDSFGMDAAMPSLADFWHVRQVLACPPALAWTNGSFGMDNEGFGMCASMPKLFF
jgi:hypothetical protein